MLRVRFKQSNYRGKNINFTVQELKKKNYAKFQQKIQIKIKIAYFTRIAIRVDGIDDMEESVSSSIYSPKKYNLQWSWKRTFEENKQLYGVAFFCVSSRCTWTTKDFFLLRSNEKSWIIK